MYAIIAIALPVTAGGCSPERGDAYDNMDRAICFYPGSHQHCIPDHPGIQKKVAAKPLTVTTT